MGFDVDNGIAAKRFLFELIKALPEFVDYQVTWSYPPESPRRAWAMVGRVTWEETSWRTNRQAEEAFSLEVVISLLRPGRTSEEAETAALEAGNAIERAVMADPTFAGLALSVTYAPESIASAPTPDGMEGQHTARVRVRARRTR